MEYTVYYFGRKMKIKWNPMWNSLYSFLKVDCGEKMERKPHELDAIFDKKTGCVVVSLHSGYGG